MRKLEEKEECIYAFDESDTDLLFRLFNDYEAEGKRMLSKHILTPGYEFLLKCSHLFNLLDARGVISPTERVVMIGRMRALAEMSAQIVSEREENHEEVSA